MSQFGSYILLFSWFLALFGALAGGLAAVGGRAALLQACINATKLSPFCALLAISALAYCFLSGDFSNLYVWQYSSRDLPAIYKFTAIWGGMEGSLLLWVFFGALACGLAAMRAKEYARPFSGWLLAVLNVSQLFFLSLVVFFGNPFRQISGDSLPLDGNGLNPLLQNPYMVIHPPLLYVGFAFLAVPFAYGLAALLARDYHPRCFRAAQDWTRLAWFFLTAGIVLGSYWAYIELGWGGYWAWDPVENASLLPWLSATAFLHTLPVQERTGSLKVWNIWLLTASYALTIFGTFITRSGIVQSVHAFSGSNTSAAFLAYLAAVLVFSLLLTLRRRRELGGRAGLKVLFSKEACLLTGALLLMAACLFTAGGILFPVFSQLFSGKQESLGRAYYSAANAPLFLGLLFLMGFGARLAWRLTSRRQVAKILAVFGVCAVLAAGLLAGLGVREPYAFLTGALCLFAVAATVWEIAALLKAAGARANLTGHFAHLGVLLMALAIAGSTLYQEQREFALKEGQSFKLSGLEFKLNRIFQVQKGNYQALAAEVSLTSGAAEPFASLQPEIRLYRHGEERAGEVALRTGLDRDIYLALAGFEPQDGTAAFQAFINPLQVWLWIGALVMLAAVTPRLFRRGV